jgi:hypothetical protein
MSGQLDLERRIDAYFAQGPNRAPDHLLGQSLRAAAGERQVRRSWWPAGYGHGARRYGVLVLAGAAVALVLGGVVIWRGGFIAIPGPTDSAVPGASSSPTATSQSALTPTSAPSTVATPISTPAPRTTQSRSTSPNCLNGCGDLPVTEDFGFRWDPVPPYLPVPMSVSAMPDDVVVYKNSDRTYSGSTEELTVATGTPARGVWLLTDGARITASDIPGLERQLRGHLPGAPDLNDIARDLHEFVSAPGTDIVVDGQPARLIETWKGPQLITMLGDRMFVISVRHQRPGYDPQPATALQLLKYDLLAFTGGFHFVRQGDQPRPSP